MYIGVVCGQELTGSDACFSSVKGDATTLVRLLVGEGRLAEACELSTTLLGNARMQLQHTQTQIGEGQRTKKMAQWTPYNLLDKLIVMARSTILQVSECVCVCVKVGLGYA